MFVEDSQSFITSNEVVDNCCPLAELPRLRSPSTSSYMKIRCREETQTRSGRHAIKPAPGVLTKRRAVLTKRRVETEP